MINQEVWDEIERIKHTIVAAIGDQTKEDERHTGEEKRIKQKLALALQELSDLVGMIERKLKSKTEAQKARDEAYGR